MPAYFANRTRLIGFTLPEILVVMGVIALLLAILVPALTGAKRSADMAKSMNNLKQISAMMAMYSSDNREYILPSQFDYSPSVAAGYPVKVRSDAGLAGTPWGDLQYKGTWTDILWSYNPNLGASNQLHDLAGAAKYRFDSPDQEAYENDITFEENPFRAGAPNTRGFMFNGMPGDGPKPFGNGAFEGGLPGYFAANNFFNTSSPEAVWYTTGQIKAPDRSLYVIDSLAGETIDPEPAPYDNDLDTIEVDFRYNGSCLMLFLDGHAAPQAAWSDLADLETRRIKVRNLHRN